MQRSPPFLLPHGRWGCSPAGLHAPPAPRGEAHLPPSHPRVCKRLRTHARAPTGDAHLPPHPLGDRGVRSSSVSPLPTTDTGVSPACPHPPPPGIAACRPHTACSDHPHCRPIPPTRHAALALGTLSPSSLDGSGALSPLLPQAVFVTASLMPHSHAILPCSPTRCPRGRAKVTQATMKLMVPALKCLA